MRFQLVCAFGHSQRPGNQATVVYESEEPLDISPFLGTWILTTGKALQAAESIGHCFEMWFSLLALATSRALITRGLSCWHLQTRFYMWYGYSRCVSLCVVIIEHGGASFLWSWNTKVIACALDAYLCIWHMSSCNFDGIQHLAIKHGNGQFTIQNIHRRSSHYNPHVSSFFGGVHLFHGGLYQCYTISYHGPCVYHVVITLLHPFPFGPAHHRSRREDSGASTRASLDPWEAGREDLGSLRSRGGDNAGPMWRWLVVSDMVSFMWVKHGKTTNTQK